MRSNPQHHHPSPVSADLRGVSFTQGFLGVNGVRTRYVSSGSLAQRLR